MLELMGMDDVIAGGEKESTEKREGERDRVSERVD